MLNRHQRLTLHLRTLHFKTTLSPVLAFLSFSSIVLYLGGCGLFLEGAFVEKSTTEEAQPFGSTDNVTIQRSSPDAGLKSGIGPKTLEPADFPLSSGHTSKVALMERSGDLLVTVDSNGEVLARRLKQPPHKVLSLPKGFEQIALSSDLTLLAEWRPNILTIYSLPSGRMVNELTRLNVRVKSLEFDPFGTSLLIGGADSRIYRWKFTLDTESISMTEREKILERYIGPASVVGSLWYHPNGRMFLSGDWFGKLYAWRPYDADKFKGEYDKNIFGSRFFGEGEVVRVGARNIARETFAIDFIKSNQDASVILLGIQNGALELWDLRGTAQRSVSATHSGPIYDIAVSPKGEVIASVGHDGLLSINQVVKTRSSVSQMDEYTFSNLLSETESPCRVLLFTDEETLLCGTKDGGIETREVKVVS